MKSRHPDREDYWHFTGPYRMNKSLHTLEGILAGVTADGKVNDAELASLRRWLEEHSDHRQRHPFNEIYPVLDEAIADGELDEDEIADLKWLCERVNPNSGQCNQFTEDMRKLQGILGGIIADGEISESELDGLTAWMDERSHLKRCWPFAEIEALIVEVMKDRRIDEAERPLLLNYFNEWTTLHGDKTIKAPVYDKGFSVSGACAVCPEITFQNKAFCFTGASNKWTRKDFEFIVMEKGGVFSKAVSKAVDFLVIGADGNPCWAFACYGRKVEQAVKLRQKGHPLLIIHEVDFDEAMN